MMKKAPKVQTKSKAHTKSGSAVQTKLAIGKPNDKHEQQADAVADQVMKMPNDEEKVSMAAMDEEKDSVQMQPEEEESVQMQPEEKEEESVQMQPEEEESVQMKEEEEVQMKSEEEESVQMQPEEEEAVQMKEEEEQVQTKEEEEKVSKKPMIQKSEGGQSVATPALANQIGASKGSGSSLPKGVSNEMGQKIGSDFSNVKVHTDSKAQEMNEGLGAKAFAHGNDVYFNKGQYNPGQPEGKKLLAHELTHVVQQKGVVQRQKQKKRGKSKHLIKSFNASIASNEIVPFVSTLDEPNITVELYFTPVLCKLSECDTSYISSFRTEVADAQEHPLRIIYTNSLEEHHITLDYVMENPGEHNLKVYLKEESPCGTQADQLDFRVEIYRN